MKRHGQSKNGHAVLGESDVVMHIFALSTRQIGHKDEHTT